MRLSEYFSNIKVVCTVLIYTSSKFNCSLQQVLNISQNIAPCHVCFLRHLSPILLFLACRSLNNSCVLSPSVCRARRDNLLKVRRFGKHIHQTLYVSCNYTQSQREILTIAGASARICGFHNKSLYNAVRLVLTKWVSALASGLKMDF